MSTINLLTLFLLCVGSCHGLECVRSGVFAHPSDCTRMYTCQGTANAGYLLEVHQCPTGTAVDKKTLRCVSSYLVPDCQKQDLDPFVSDPLCEEQLIHCMNCTHIVSCTFSEGSYINPVIDSCGVGTGGEPLYCDPIQKKCVPELPNNCSVPGYSCSGAGYFPDLNDCSIYHVCDDTLFYQSFRCSDSEKPSYNSEDFRCDNQSGCVPVSCSAIGVEEYLPDDRYYVFCSETGPHLYACPGNLRFDPTTNECSFSCILPGLFTDMSNCYNFIRCEDFGSGDLVATTETCQMGLAFNPNSGACENLSNVKCPPS